MNTHVQEIAEQIAPILEQHGVEYAGVFGSYARGEARPESDVDILVKFKETPGLIRLIRIENDLAQRLHRGVDLLTVGFLHPIVRERALEDLQDIYGQRHTLQNPHS